MHFYYYSSSDQFENGIAIYVPLHTIYNTTYECKVYMYNILCRKYDAYT